MEFFPSFLTGPQFLLFYPVFALGVAVLVRYLSIRRQAAHESVLPRLTDPYRIAVLRDGRHEAVRLAVASLAKRGVLTVKPDRSIRVADAAPESLEHPLEDAVLRFYREGVSQEGVADYPAVRSTTSAIHAELEDQGLLSPAAQRGLTIAPAVGIPLVIALIRLHASQIHPHGLLLLELFGCALLACFITDQRLTPLGRATREHLQALFRYAGSRGRDPAAQAGSADVTLLLAATFGITALAQILAFQPEWLRSQIASMQETFDLVRTKNKDPGCGGGCGGDGCGGCGGCGG